MKKGQKIVCVDSKKSNYLTVGKEYVITSGKGDSGLWCDTISSDTGFRITDDEGDTIYQNNLSGLHGTFEVIK